MAYGNDPAVNRVISLLEQLYQIIGQQSSGGSATDVTVLNPSVDYSLETTQQDVLTQLQNLVLSSDYISTDFTDRSSTITTLNVSQQLAAANVNRRYLLVQNISDTDMFINFGTIATTSSGSIKLLPNGSYELSSTTGGYINTQAVNIICSVAGKEFTAKEA